MLRVKSLSSYVFSGFLAYLLRNRSLINEINMVRRCLFLPVGICNRVQLRRKMRLEIDLYWVCPFFICPLTWNAKIRNFSLVKDRQHILETLTRWCATMNLQFHGIGSSICRSIWVPLNVNCAGHVMLYMTSDLLESLHFSSPCMSVSVFVARSTQSAINHFNHFQTTDPSNVDDKMICGDKFYYSYYILDEWSARLCEVVDHLQ